jgi:hypothetical protein
MATPSAKIIEELAELRSEFSEFHSEFAEFRSEFAETISEISEKQLEISTILDEIKAENSQITALMTMLADVQSQITKLSVSGVSPLSVDESAGAARPKTSSRSSKTAAAGGGGGSDSKDSSVKYGTVVITLYKNIATITGNGTYARREVIKKHGGSWNKELNAWTCPLDKSDPLIADLKRYCKEATVEKVAETIDVPESAERPTKGLKKSTYETTELGISF